MTLLEICTNLSQLGLGVSCCLWHKNGGALHKISVFHTSYLLARLVWEPSSVPLWVVSLATRTMQLLAGFPVGSLCDLVLLFCVCKRKGVLSPFLLAETLQRESSPEAAPQHASSGSAQAGSHGCQPFPVGWWVWTMSCQENYLS